MAVDFNVKVTGDKELSARFGASKKVAADVIEKNLRSLGIIIAAKERQVLEVVKYKGTLARSVSIEYEASPPNGFSVRIGPTAPERFFVYDGTKPHIPPIAPLKEWARWKLGDENAAYAIQKSIAHQGTSTWIERMGLGDGKGGYDYPSRTLLRGDVRQGIERAGKRMGLDLVTFIDTGKIP